MRICIIVEGCYPHVVGGVSSWVHSMIRSFPRQEFVVVSIVAERSLRGKFAYTMPENVTEVHELYLNDVDWGTHLRKKRMSRVEYNALRSLLLDQQVDWETLFEYFQKSSTSLNRVLMGEDFLEAVKEFYRLNYSQMVFSDFLWMMRSIYLPLFQTMKMQLPEADLYHCVCTGYAGVLGSMAKHFYGGRMLISEHGIYTREREEELLKAKWLQGIYKNIWINQFRKMSRLAYNRADLVTSLYEHARELQVELECPAAKTRVTPNGIPVERFQDLPGKTQEDEGKINLGAVIRVTPIKDVKTLIQAFSFAKEREPALKLWIMGPWDNMDEDYARECFELVDDLGLTDVVFTGRIDVRDYLGRMDMTILTSISEGQPLTILESFAARRPVIATDVGNCRGLVLGEGDDLGAGGIIAHVMNLEEISQAILYLAHHPQERREMGEIGYRRVTSRYRLDQLQATYREIYQSFAKSAGVPFEGDGAEAVPEPGAPKVQTAPEAQTAPEPCEEVVV